MWSLPNLLSLNSTETHEPLRTLSNHRAAVTSIAIGHSASGTNICVSGGRDNTIIVWNYISGDLLRTYLLPSTPLCLALDPCDRAGYAGFEDGSLQVMEFIHPISTLNSLYDSRLQNTPVQVTTPPWVTPSDVGSVHCIGLSYDGTSLLSGHESGQVFHWDSARHTFSGQLADLNAPVTNLLMLSPFQENHMTKAVTVVKPKLGQSNYPLSAQLIGTMRSSSFDHVVRTSGFRGKLLQDAVCNFSSPVAASATGDEKLQRENEELWKIVNEQRDLQRKTWEKYTRLKSGTV